VPAKLLFTLPSLSPLRCKFNRILEICRALDRTKYAPIVSVDHPGRLREEGRAALAKADVPVLLLRMSPHRRQLRASVAEMLQTGRKLRELGVVLQHSSDYSNSPLEPMLARSGSVRHFVVTKTNSVTRGIGWGMRWRFSDRVVLQSHALASELTRGSPQLREKVIVIPNGVRTDVYRPRSESDSPATVPPWLDRGKLVLACVAHLVRVKDHISLIRALARTECKGHVRLLLVGDAVDVGYAETVRAEIVSLGLTENAAMLGARRDLPDILPRVDGIILTSTRESLPNAILEGMACGLPVICSDAGGMRDLARPGVNGWLVKRGPGFVEDLAEAIDEWAEDEAKRKSCGEASRMIAEREFSVEQMVRKHIELYDSLLK
jgi:glycosyltransferase involved in cell wall biosynthesis